VCEILIISAGLQQALFQGELGPTLSDVDSPSVAIRPGDSPTLWEESLWRQKRSSNPVLFVQLWCTHIRAL